MKTGDKRQLELEFMRHAHRNGDVPEPLPYAGGGIVLVLDLDGTLRAFGGDVPLVLILALQALEKLGVRIVFASGKHLRHIAGLARAMKLGPIAVCAEDGGHLVSDLQGHTIDKVDADTGLLEQVREHLQRCETCGGFERTTARALEEQDKVSMVTIYFPNEAVAREKVETSLRLHLRDLLQRDPVIQVHPDGAVDIKSSEDTTKGGVILYLRKFATAHQAIIVIGDGRNDLPMMERTGVTNLGCPTNACAEVRKLIASKGVHGHVATAMHGEGTLEVLHHLIEQGVLPEYREAK